MHVHNQPTSRWCQEDQGASTPRPSNPVRVPSGTSGGDPWNRYHQVISAELAVRRDELNANRTQLAAQLGAATPPAPNRNELQAIGSCIRAAVNEGSPDAVKQALATLIDRVEISPDRHAQPYFRVPTPDMERLGPAMARASRTPVRMEPHQVELWGIEPQASSMRPRRSTN